MTDLLEGVGTLGETPNHHGDRVEQEEEAEWEEDEEAFEQETRTKTIQNLR